MRAVKSAVKIERLFNHIPLIDEEDQKLCGLLKTKKECRAFIQTSKKGFTSLTALQAAMRKANKSDDTTQMQADVESTKNETEKESNVGQLDTTVKMDKYQLAKSIQEICLSNKIDDAELIEILMLNAEANIQQKAA